MKSALKSAWTAARRAFAWYHMRAIETNLAVTIKSRRIAGGRAKSY